MAVESKTHICRSIFTLLQHSFIAVDKSSDERMRRLFVMLRMNMPAVRVFHQCLPDVITDVKCVCTFNLNFLLNTLPRFL
jgi:hypothetical protein